jgi:hypothetical protein
VRVHVLLDLREPEISPKLLNCICSRFKVVPNFILFCICSEGHIIVCDRHILL